MDQHPIHLVVTGDLQRSRLTVFFRYLLAIPHLIWVGLWGYAVGVAALIQWFITLFAGRPAASLHGFIARYTRQSVHVNSYLLLAANPFPGFTGEPGYAVDVALPGPEAQSRLITLFRLLLVIPAVFVALIFGILAYICVVIAWFAAMFTGRVPAGLQHWILVIIALGAQINGYLYLLTDRYPSLSPSDLAPPTADAAAVAAS